VKPRLWVVMPALNEATAIGEVLAGVARSWIDIGERAPWSALQAPLCIVVDNGSTDDTAERARRHGAQVVYEPRRGYGQACLSGLQAIAAAQPTANDLVTFLDADASDDPGDLPALLRPLLVGEADLVVGSRVLGERESGALLPQQRVGNWLATRAIGRLTGVRFTDLGPFRALSWSTLCALQLRDRDFGWTVEMQLKAAAQGLRCVEVPVRYRRRIGRSKISGTLRGSWLAGTTILRTLARFWIESRRRRGRPQ
jgi:glycosyltransferase involved in cell wall biosynthesis